MNAAAAPVAERRPRAVAPKLQWYGGALDLGVPRVMGILNVTPDSFSDGGRFLDPGAAVEHAHRMVAEGAAVIDVGGESTRPGASAVGEDDELGRVIPVVRRLAGEIRVPISVDTSKAKVISAAIDTGAVMVNDVRALRMPGALEAALAADCAVCLVHMRGEPRTMQKNPRYDDVVAEIGDFLEARADACVDAGIPPDRIAIDPGFGFGKTAEHNLRLLRHLPDFLDLGYPLLVGLSRKSTIARITRSESADRLAGSVTGAALAAWLGASLLRVHDVRETVQAVAVIDAVRRAGSP